MDLNHWKVWAGCGLAWLVFGFGYTVIGDPLFAIGAVVVAAATLGRAYVEYPSA